jgi:hypothetical protein
MRFILGFLLGYCIRGNKRLLMITLTAIAVVYFIVLPAVALSLLAISVRHERLSRPPQTTVPISRRVKLQDSGNQIARCQSQHPCSGEPA